MPQTRSTPLNINGDTLLREMAATHEIFWANPNLLPAKQALPDVPLDAADVDDAAARLERFRPYLAKVFPETAPAGGLIESPLRELPTLRRELEDASGRPFAGRLMAKLDSELPISGSIKARGGIYEVLKLAETIALANGVLTLDDDYAVLDGPEARVLFSRYRVAVGSTGNLGLSIGVMGAALGFAATVHMSADARTWKKAMLRSKGVRVVEYESDYSRAVREGRAQAEDDPFCHFVDDENSTDLFLGYAVAARRLKAQLDERGIAVDAAHPLYVYLPCGVGGGPGGLTFGLKLVFGDAARCFFAEPTHAPAMLLGLYTGLHEGVSVRDLGLDVRTAADGLAVGRPSGFVGRALRHCIDGAYTVSDDSMFRWLSMARRTEGLRLEPSALAGFPGALRIGRDGAHGAEGMSADATHLVWATGGGMVPEDVWEKYLAKGSELDA